MKRPILIITLFALPLGLLLGCDQGDSTNALQAKIDTLKAAQANAYVPGTGEIMNNIVQPHHYKLWLAGRNNNWELAKYESHLLLGGFKRIQKYHRGTPEANATPMIYPQITAVENAIKQKDAEKFNQSYSILTSVCNTCHQATGYKFNVITVPKDSQGSYADQAF